MGLDNKRVLVVGLGKSGQAAALTLSRRTALVEVCDAQPQGHFDMEMIAELQEQGIKVTTGGYPEVNPRRYDLLVASPGIAPETEPLRQALQYGIPVIGEVELAYQIKKPQVTMLAVTGTNGKTTTTALLEHILTHDGQRAAAGGNIGIPLTKLAAEMQEGIIAVEMSSFQLETIKTFRPRVSGMLNITPDHLDRHKTMQAYSAAKARIFENQTASDHALLNYEDETIRKLARQCPAQVCFFSRQRPLEQGVFIADRKIIIADGGISYPVCGQDEVLLRGSHNMENILCATGMAYCCGVSIPIIAAALRTFRGVRHRMEEVARIDGILYVNDSKATNPESVMKALDAYQRPLILIAGGRNKGSRFDQLAAHIKAKVKALILLGEAKGEIRQAVMDADFQNIYEVDTLATAVSQARQLAHSGDVVLLSPACASWDMFLNYEQRGDIFCDLVRNAAVSH